jgi:prevent-host-death family protein
MSKTLKKGVVTNMERTGGHAWQIQTAKARFSEVFRLARTEGPQWITRQGKEGVVMISDEQYERPYGQVASAEEPRAVLPGIAAGRRRARFRTRQGHGARH